MANKSNSVLIVLAVIGAIALVGVWGMRLMMVGMMSSGGMMICCGACSAYSP